MQNLINILLDYHGYIIILLLVSLVLILLRANNAFNKRTRETENIHTLLKNAGMGLWRWNPVSNQLIFNSLWRSLTGYSVDDSKGGVEFLKSIADPKDHRIIDEIFSKLMEGKLEPCSMEYRLRRKDGKQVWVRDFGVPNDGCANYNERCMLFVTREIDGSKKAEIELQRSESRFKELFNNMTSGVAVYKALNDGKDFIFTDFNKAAERINNVKKEDLIGKSVLKVFPGVKDFGLFQVFQDVWRTGDAHYHPMSMYADDKITYWVENHVYKLPGGEIVAVHDDVTEFKKKEESLKQSEQRYRTLFELANDAIFVHQLSKQSDYGRFLDVNEVACNMLGYSKEELLKLSPKDLYSGSEVLKIKEVLKLITEKKEAVFETKHLTKTGDEIPVEISSHFIKLGRNNVVLSIVRDVTDRKRSEIVLKKMLMEKELLLKEIHHRVKNNLQIISSLLSLEAETINDIEIKELFRNSRSRIRSMALIHEKLYMSENLSNISFPSYIRSLVSYLIGFYQVPSGKVDFESNIDEIVLNIDYAVPCGLIINELVTNSIKHAFPAERNGRIKIDFTKSWENICYLKISDNGVGLPEGFVLEQKAKSLGLQLVQILVEQMSGLLSYRSNKGTEFEIKFNIET